MSFLFTSVVDPSRLKIAWSGIDEPILGLGVGLSLLEELVFQGLFLGEATGILTHFLSLLMGN